MKKIVLFFAILFIPFSSNLFACVFEDLGPDTPSLVDPNIVPDTIFKFEDRLNFKRDKGFPDLCVGTLLEWQDYFKKYQKLKLPLSRLAKTFWVNEELSPLDLEYIRQKEKTSEEKIKNAKPIDLSAYADIQDYYNFMLNSKSSEAERTACLQKAQDKSLDLFLRAKWAYQVVRYDVISESYSQGVTDYANLTTPLKIDSLVHYRTLGYVARAWYKTGHADKAAQLYLDLFDQCEPMRKEALNSLIVIGDRQNGLKGLLPQTTNPHRKNIALYVQNLLFGRDYSTETLSAMIQNGPQEIATEMTLVRILQDIEEDHLPTLGVHLIGRPAVSDRVPSAIYHMSVGSKFLQAIYPDKEKTFEQSHVQNNGNCTESETGLFHGYFPPRYPVNYIKLDPLIDLCEKAAIDPHIRRPALWYWAATYLSLLSGDTPRAAKDMTPAARFGNKDASLIHSLHLTQTLLDLAQNPKVFPKDILKRLIVDLNWAAEMNDPSLVESGWVPANPRIEGALYNLLTEKYIYQGDWARAVIFTSLSPQYNNYRMGHVALLLDLSTLEDLQKIRSLIYVLKAHEKDHVHDQPLDHLLSKTKLLPQDISYYLAIRKAKTFDYAGALEEMKKLNQQSPDYSSPSAKSVKEQDDSDYVGKIYCSGSLWISPKIVGFQTDRRNITGNDRDIHLDLLPFLEKMADLEAKLLEGRKGDPAEQAQAAFEMAKFYATESWSGWPEFRCQRNVGERRDYDLGNYEFGFPFFSFELQKVLYDRCSRYISETPDFYQTAGQYFKEVIDSKGDRELAAQSLAFLSIINQKDDYGRDKTYKTFLTELKTRYQDTDFYKRYKSICSYLN